MHLQHWQTSWVVHAPAKVNLFFEVLGRREDGYHLVETLVCPITLYDTLLLQKRTDDQIVLCVEWAWQGKWANICGRDTVPADDRNLVARAAQLIREETGARQGASITIIKRIPTGAGLGGGSSDAAAALVGLSRLWELDVNGNTLHAWAARLGSDVPLFLGRGPSLCRGRGEIVEPVAPGAPLHLVVVKPPVSLATRDVYQACRVPEGPHTSAELLAAWQAGDWARLSKGLFNRLEEPAQQLAPELKQLRQHLAGTGAVAVSMTGSGSCYFGIYYHRRQALAAARRLLADQCGAVFVVQSAL